MAEITQGLGQWYALAVIAGRENKIRERILDRLEKREVRVPGLSIVCPDEEVIIEEPGQERKSKRRMTLPGYLLVHGQRISADALILISEVQGVLSFLGSGDRPTPLSASEVERILGTPTSGPQTQTTKVSLFEVGEEVSIIEGPMSGFTGVIQEVNENSESVKLEVEIFGRKTLASANFRHLKKGR